MGNNNILDVNEIDFETKVLEESTKKLVVVDFWAPWCGPCKQLTPILEKVISLSPDKIVLAKINIDENQQIAAQLRIQSIPAVFAFKDKQPVNAFQGVIPETEIIKFLEKSIGEKITNNFEDFYDQIKILLDKNKFLEDEIKKLDGKKIIFTNGSRAHALNVTKRIGIDKLFDGIFDIRDCEFIPKPSKEPYKKLVENYKIEPQYCIFFEDIARNLKPAYELGMKTVWIKNDEPWAAKYSDSKFINYKTDNLAKFLKEINELR